MAEIRRATLFGKLNSLGYKGIEVGHRLLQDARQSLRGNRPLDPSTAPVAGLRRAPHHQAFPARSLPARRRPDRLAGQSAARAPPPSPIFRPHIADVVERGWVYRLPHVSANFRCAPATSSSAFSTRESPAQVSSASRASSRKIKLEALTDDFAKIVGGSPEDALRASDGSGLSAGAAPGEASGAIAPGGHGQTGGPCNVSRWI